MVKGSSGSTNEMGSQERCCTIAVQISRCPHVSSAAPEVNAWNGTTIRRNALSKARLLADVGAAEV
ncbi:hypothetical protein GCM10020218_062770 [Dactylosporangium vinaceum]